LLGPDVPLNELNSAEWPEYEQTANISKLFSSPAFFSSGDKFQPLTKLSIEARILESLDVSYAIENDVPAGYFRSVQHELSSEVVWCLDPVYIQVDRDEAVLVANESLCLEESEARSLIDALNQHFKQDGLSIHYHNQHQWLMLGDIGLLTHSLSDAIFQNINEHQPTGKDESKWRTIINEVQMLLHCHPVNEQRVEQGGMPANSLWIWGGGQHLTTSSLLDLVLSDEWLAKDVTRYAGVSYDTLPSKVDPAVLCNKNSLLIFTEQMKSVRQNDVFGWFDCLRRFDKGVLGPLFGLLHKNEIDVLYIKSDTISISMTRKDLKESVLRLFKKAGGFESGIKRLREKYGY